MRKHKDGNEQKQKQYFLILAVKKSTFPLRIAREIFIFGMFQVSLFRHTRQMRHSYWKSRKPKGAQSDWLYSQNTPPSY